MSVTAIIPTYNRAGYLEEAIASVLGQTQPLAQVLVVDDGSEDNTREVVSKFGSQIEYIRKPNGGKSSALNLGLRHARSDFVWIFDDDDIAEPDALERLVYALRKEPECGFAYGDYDRFTTDDGRTIRRFPAYIPVKPDNLFLSVLVEPCFIFQAGLLVRKSCYDEVGVFDESLIRSQDYEMLLRLVRRYQGIKVAGIIFHQRQHQGMRGSAASPVPAKRVLEIWLRNDQNILARVYETHVLRDFIPGRSSGLELSSEQKFAALLQRSCIMARRGLWDKAGTDLRQAGEIARETQKRTLTMEEEAILRRIFDLFSFAPHTFASASNFRLALNEIRPLRLQRVIRTAVLWPLPLTVGATFVNRQYANFWHFLHTYLQLATPYSAFRALFSKAFLETGLQLLKARIRG